ncbi:general stress protein [Arthrobacter sp. 9MFCol3.1]|uniref:general stress protein n=1 Tax=Arthrobacter sp. 9MFCol3.1 TaxID=1150398 RepID=UPI0009DDAF85|nr:hypothetical protein [Arthrobacter sp. 9MFCol3.1]
MAGTREGGLKAAATNKARYGDGTNGKPNFYKVIGHLGGKVSKNNPFKDHDKAVEAGRRGGQVSRRGKKQMEGGQD